MEMKEQLWWLILYGHEENYASIFNNYGGRDYNHGCATCGSTYE